MSKELIQRAQSGDTQALNDLIEAHRSLAYSIALKYLKNNEDAEDVTQNAFIIVFKYLKNFRSESNFSTWLYKIIYHECLKELKLKKQTIEYFPEFTKLEPLSEIIEKEINIEELLNYLKPSEYIVISLFYLKEKSIKDISQITTFSESNIKVILHRGRARLKEIHDTKLNNNEG